MVVAVEAIHSLAVVEAMVVAAVDGYSLVGVVVVLVVAVGLVVHN